MAEVSIRDLVVEHSSGGYVVRPINGLDVQAGDGELMRLLGASGCGKTTLLSALAVIRSAPSSRRSTSSDGVIELTRERENTSPEIVARIIAGQYFGELAPMFGLPLSATARAVGRTTIRGCSPSEFRASMGKHAVDELIGNRS